MEITITKTTLFRRNALRPFSLNHYAATVECPDGNRYFTNNSLVEIKRVIRTRVRQLFGQQTQITFKVVDTEYHPVMRRPSFGKLGEK